MKPTGTYDPDTRTLVMRRTFSASIDDVWASITESARLSRWYGSWTGDPSTGSVMVTMNAEPGEPTAVRYEIEACDPPRLLSVRAGDESGVWHLSAQLAEHGSGTELTFRQYRLDPDAASSVGPGWEWYLDRLVASINGEQPPSLESFERDYLSMGTAYASDR